MVEQWRKLKVLLLKSAYKLTEESSGLRDDPGLVAFVLKASVDAAVFILLLYTVSEVAASLWRVSESLLARIP